MSPYAPPFPIAMNNRPTQRSQEGQPGRQQGNSKEGGPRGGKRGMRSAHVCTRQPREQPDRDRATQHRQSSGSVESGLDSPAKSPSESLGVVTRIREWMENLDLNDQIDPSEQTGASPASTSSGATETDPTTFGSTDPNTIAMNDAEYDGRTYTNRPPAPPDGMVLHELGWIPPERRREKERDNQVFVYEDSSRRRREERKRGEGKREKGVNRG